MSRKETIALLREAVERMRIINAHLTAILRQRYEPHPPH